MFKSYDKCPVCGKDMRYKYFFNDKCQILNKHSFSFIESVCNHYDTNQIKFENPPTHLFSQISSLSNEKLFEKVDLPVLGYEIYVNYVMRNTTIVYFTKNKYEKDYLIPEKVVLNNRLIALDYPYLINTLNKIKTLATFL